MIRSKFRMIIAGLTMSLAMGATAAAAQTGKPAFRVCTGSEAAKPAIAELIKPKN